MICSIFVTAPLPRSWRFDGEVFDPLSPRVPAWNIAHTSGLESHLIAVSSKPVWPWDPPRPERKLAKLVQIDLLERVGNRAWQAADPRSDPL